MEHNALAYEPEQLMRDIEALIKMTEIMTTRMCFIYSYNTHYIGVYMYSTCIYYIYYIYLLLYT